MKINEIINEEWPWKSAQDALGDLPLVGNLIKSKPYYKNDWRKGPVTNIEGDPIKNHKWHDHKEYDPNHPNHDLGNFATALQQIGPKAAKYYDIELPPKKRKKTKKFPIIKAPNKRLNKWQSQAFDDFNHPLFKYMDPKRQKQVKQQLRFVLPGITPQLRSAIPRSGRLRRPKNDLENILKNKRKV
tara:strand:+ start:1769 stop:2326 length:558 start_codon:yes stop_codon:yes gene_type:complete